jgi:hypothetical protein
LQKPKADIEVGLAESIAVILANQAMDENRRVYFSEIEKMGTGAPGGEEGLAHRLQPSAGHPARSCHSLTIPIGFMVRSSH